MNAESHALEFWEPRRALTLDAARRHSLFIRRARLSLLFLALVLTLLLIWYFLRVPTRTTVIENPDESVKMINPVYKDITADGLPYRITADEAVRFIDNEDELHLLNPVLHFLRSASADESRVLAQSGLYNNKKNILELRADVDLKTDDGYACLTSHARVFVSDKRIEGDEPISCTGDFGKASGNAYEINDEYTEFVFKNGMSARLNPDQADAAFIPDIDTQGSLDGEGE